LGPVGPGRFPRPGGANGRGERDPAGRGRGRAAGPLIRGGGFFFFFFWLLGVLPQGGGGAPFLGLLPQVGLHPGRSGPLAGGWFVGGPRASATKGCGGTSVKGPPPAARFGAAGKGPPAFAASDGWCWPQTAGPRDWLTVLPFVGYHPAGAGGNRARFPPAGKNPAKFAWRAGFFSHPTLGPAFLGTGNIAPMRRVAGLSGEVCHPEKKAPGHGFGGGRFGAQFKKRSGGARRKPRLGGGARSAVLRGARILGQGLPARTWAPGGDQGRFSTFCKGAAAGSPISPGFPLRAGRPGNCGPALGAAAHGGTQFFERPSVAPPSGDTVEGRKQAPASRPFAPAAEGG